MKGSKDFGWSLVLLVAVCLFITATTGQEASECDLAGAWTHEYEDPETGDSEVITADFDGSSTTVEYDFHFPDYYGHDCSTQFTFEGSYTLIGDQLTTTFSTCSVDKCGKDCLPQMCECEAGLGDASKLFTGDVSYSPDCASLSVTSHSPFAFTISFQRASSDSWVVWMVAILAAGVAAMLALVAAVIGVLFVLKKRSALSASEPGMPAEGPAPSDY
mmetsp:Transcript_7828/g.32931  ORF Transcript_7828/g.32931 Transcript_7828/m.32931 type:complete len:217 (+) Transcript_7828:96-746(+)|eukprot:CAMPEP_0114624878 /NCGR_PEP_ID=MMETSP0168-20121206/10987_1 /TAXON_ID=95228 ORGANISM="Vannella sp., Strain DIVA3 517/6/12" /NCGR_SAMPLE_ID=MMETSP0168 /ASSEMBLY_ACC=CAM_ASM_000044 /LENGTH=216 /DNA_ID=CAMNT_0001836153 /DNA_START=73 /DNA_END=723 /DNA_ORIENTATION=+